MSCLISQALNQLHWSCFFGNKPTLSNYWQRYFGLVSENNLRNDFEMENLFFSAIMSMLRGKSLRCACIQCAPKTIARLNRKFKIILLIINAKILFFYFISFIIIHSVMIIFFIDIIVWNFVHIMYVCVLINFFCVFVYLFYPWVCLSVCLIV